MKPRRERWKQKFAAAGMGVFRSLREESSFHVHLPVTVVVLGLASLLRVEPWRWCVLGILIAAVWSAELFNTAIEHLVRALHPAHDLRIGRALDASAGAVLVLALASVAVGLAVLGPPLWDFIWAFAEPPPAVPRLDPDGPIGVTRIAVDSTRPATDAAGSVAPPPSAGLRVAVRFGHHR